MIRISILLITLLFFVSCHTSKSVIQTTKKGSKTYDSEVRTTRKSSSKKANENTASTKKSQNNTPETQVLEATTRVKVTNKMILEYIENYKDVAQSNMKKYGIPASIILGQAILESGSGTGPLCVQANNHFGIKCHKDWLGESIKYDDDTIDECFRKYDNPYDSFRDHALFLTAGSRYSQLFKLSRTDYKAWARGLKDAGYATDSQYPAKLISLIERFQLYQYDSEYGKNEVAERNKPNDYQQTDLYVVSKGDTLYSISKRYNIPIEEIRKKNKLSDNSISIGQSIILK
ncbi:MAG: glucosaminidase domain-containing protein [Flavobacterium sp.]|uniref:glucosaminidase domain-containing protein n=1 Tax=Flavobacterium sp. TaxID=239 RepID=UPI00262DA901|nr:glucosaminidase domain-containing protein [Flavobacterium sp.]MDD5150513.1 glucosaminidase domain-containing protein [Flavobacterium sp.]